MSSIARPIINFLKAWNVGNKLLLSFVPFLAFLPLAKGWQTSNRDYYPYSEAAINGDLSNDNKNTRLLL